MYAGPHHMYGEFVARILVERKDFAADWWQMVQSRVRAHQQLGTQPEVLADLFSDEWRIIRETGGWKGPQQTQAQAPTKAMQDTLRFCAAARRHGFA